MSGPGATTDEEHYVELLTTSRDIRAVCDCGAESRPSWSSTEPTLWAQAHTARPVTTGECDQTMHSACPWYVWADAEQPTFCSCSCHAAVPE